MKFSKKIYWKNPIFIKWYNFLRESQWWSRRKLEEYQMRELKKLLKHAYKNVPYYSRIFDERGLKPKDIQDFDDLKKLPYLTKDDVQRNLKDLVARNIPREKIKYVATGGTSGNSLRLYIEKRTYLIRMAFAWREWDWMGCKFGDKCVVLRGNLAQRKQSDEFAWWKYNRENNYLVLSTYDMTEENLSKYVEKIKEFKPKIIQAYPSAIDILARFIKENNLEINTKGNIKAISTSAENLYPAQRKLVEEVFQCPIFDKYGNCEQVTILGECEKHKGYHDFMEHSYTEVLNREGKTVTKEGKIGEIVSTGFTNYAMPFIRYRTGDLVKYTTHDCSCGRKLPLIKSIEGRLQEVIITKNGNLISMVTLINMRPDVFDNIKRFQFYQDTLGKVIFKVVRKDTYTNKETRYVLQELQKKMKRQVEIEIKFVNKILLTDKGKYKFLVQKLPIGDVIRYE